MLGQNLAAARMGGVREQKLNEAGPRVFFLLQARCPVMVQDVGVPVRSLVLRQGTGRKTDRQY